MLRGPNSESPRKRGRVRKESLPTRSFRAGINAINGSGKCRAYYSDNYSTTSNNIHFTLKENISDVSLKFIYNLIQYNISILEEGFSGGNQKKISQDYISSVQIPLPPLPIQHEVLAILNEMEAELQTLEQMAAKAEQRAKFILDGYLTPAPQAEPVAENVMVTSLQAEEKPVKKRVFKVVTGPV